MLYPKLSMNHKCYVMRLSWNTLKMKMPRNLATTIVWRWLMKPKAWVCRHPMTWNQIHIIVQSNQGWTFIFSELNMQKKKLGKRHTFESLRSYFIVILTPQVDPRVVHQLCDLYEAARFNPKPFEEEEYQAFSNLLKQLRNAYEFLNYES